MNLASGGTLVEHWNGITWSIVTSPNPDRQQRLTTVRRVPHERNELFCGRLLRRRVAYKGLVEHWNGTSWSIVASPNPYPIIGRFLLGVSCSSGMNCSAVGYFTYGMYRFTLGRTIRLIAASSSSGERRVLTRVLVNVSWRGLAR